MTTRTRMGHRLSARRPLTGFAVRTGMNRFRRAPRSFGILQSAAGSLSPRSARQMRGTSWMSDGAAALALILAAASWGLLLALVGS